MSGFVQRALAWERRLWETTDMLPKAILKVIRVTLLVVRGIMAEKPATRAAALTYTSTLTLIPTLAMVFGIIEFIFPAENYQAEILNAVSKVIDDPDRADAISTRAIQAIETINGGGIAGFALILVLAGALTLISNIEHSFNNIWGISNLRPFKMRFMNYLTILITGPLVLITASTVLGARGMSVLESVPLVAEAVPYLRGPLATLMPFILLVLFLSMLYYMIPNVRVGLKAAFAGGLIAGMLFSANQIIAVFLVGRFATMNKIYGSMSIVPILLIWLFIAWVIILIGAQIVYAWDNVEGFRREYLLNGVSHGLEEVIAVRLMVEMARQFHRSGEALDYEDLGETWQLPNRLLRSVLERLKDCGLVHHLGDRESRFVPGRELEKITIADILMGLKFGPEGFRVPGGADEKAQKLCAEAIQPTGDEAQKTLRDLVDES